MTQNWYTVDKGPHMAGHRLPSGRRQFGEVSKSTALAPDCLVFNSGCPPYQLLDIWQVSLTFYFEPILDSQKSCKNSTEFQHLISIATTNVNVLPDCSTAP